jgi:chromosome partitioning protein
MRSILIANPKGGSGKSTLATNLAGWLARQGQRVMLGDIDRQQSARQWLRLRPAVLPRIDTWQIEMDKPARPPAGTTHAVLDTPAGLHGKKLAHVLRVVDQVVVPLQPSLFDILATRQFLAELAEEKNVREQHAFVAVVGMRVDARTRAAGELERFLDGLGLPVLTCLRDTQNYVQAAAHGMTIFDLPASRAAQDWAQWQAIVDWVGD